MKIFFTLLKCGETYFLLSFSVFRNLSASGLHLSPLQKRSSTHSLGEGPSVKIIPRNFGSKSQSSADDLQ